MAIIDGIHTVVSEAFLLSCILYCFQAIEPVLRVPFLIKPNCRVVNTEWSAGFCCAYRVPSAPVTLFFVYSPRNLCGRMFLLTRDILASKMENMATLCSTIKQKRTWPERTVKLPSLFNPPQYTSKKFVFPKEIIIIFERNIS